MSYQISPFVKWAGGKKQILSHLISRMPAYYHRYYEPFIGGGALLLAVQPQNAIINDINPQLLNVYRQLQSNAEAVIASIQSLDAILCDQDHYLAMRETYNQKISANELDANCAALMIWLNKHCFNGLYRVNSKGLFNVPYNNKTTGVSMNENNLRDIGLYLNQCHVEIREGDFELACADAKEGDFVYFDSPYIPVSQTANFTDYAKDGFNHEDHVRLSNVFKKLTQAGVKVMLSNNDVDLIYKLYDGFYITPIDVKRAINRDTSKRTGKEVIITNYELSSNE